MSKLNTTDVIIYFSIKKHWVGEESHLFLCRGRLNKYGWDVFFGSFFDLNLLLVDFEELFQVGSKLKVCVYLFEFAR